MENWRAVPLAGGTAGDWVDSRAVSSVEMTVESSGMRWVDCLAAEKAEWWAGQLENWKAVPLADAMAVYWADQWDDLSAVGKAESSEKKRAVHSAVWRADCSVA